MEAIESEEAPPEDKRRFALSGLLLLTFFGYFYSNPKVPYYYDYTLRTAGVLLDGQVGQTEQPPVWLNEMVPFDGKYYSVFPLGSVLTLMPIAVMKKIGLIDENPAALLGAFCATLIGLFYFLLSLRYELTLSKRIALVGTMLFGTWMWTNLMFTGSWQLALGVAMLGEVAALYFTIVKRQPLLAGFCFAMAFGNRTEILLTAPVFCYLLVREKRDWKAAAQFCVAPFLLGVATLAYNQARFQSPFDFGHARIPGVLSEPWYRHGIFSIAYIPLNFGEMLVTPWRSLPTFPYLVPTGFGGSILLSSPFLILLFRPGAKDQPLTRAAWAAIAVITGVLWCHGNPGGWQFSYRYAMVLLPWIFLILLENGPRKLTLGEGVLFSSSIAINAFATWLFFWTDYVKP